jgi:hypothetical protein
MLSYIANINTAQIIQAICKSKNILILNSQEGETDINQYIKETKVNFNLIKYLVIDISALVNSDTEIIESIYNFSKLYTRARIIIIAAGYDCQNAVLTNLYDLGFYNIINDLEFAEKLNIALDTGLQKKDAKKFEKKVEVIQKESKFNKITDKLKQLRTNKKIKSKKETNIDMPTNKVYLFSLLLEAVTRLVKFICYLAIFGLTSVGLTILLNEELRGLVFQIFGLK